MSDTARYDTIVIGGGPGGSTTAALLAQSGRKVLVLERERFPRFRIGESLLPLGRGIYRQLGVDDEMEKRFIKKWGAQFINGKDGLEQTFEFANAMESPFPYAYHVPRAEHDQVLLDNARSRGAEVREGYLVDDVLFEGDRAVGVTAREKRPDGSEGPRETFRSTFVVDASGRWSLLAKKLRLREPVDGMNKAAVFTHYRGVVRLPEKFEGSPTIVTFRGGWFWVIPFKGDITSVGAVMHHFYWREKQGLTPEQLLEAAIAESPAMQAKLADATRALDVMSEGSFSYNSKRYSGPGWVLCGDAAAFLDPVFSSGVYLSMVCGREIAGRIERGLATGDVSERIFKGYREKMMSGMQVFWKFIYGFYDEAFFNMFMRPTKRLKLVPAITGVLAGNIFPSFRFRVRMWMMDFVVFVARIVFRFRGQPTVDRARA